MHDPGKSEIRNPKPESERKNIDRREKGVPDLTALDDANSDAAAKTLLERRGIALQVGGAGDRDVGWDEKMDD